MRKIINICIILLVIMSSVSAGTFAAELPVGKATPTLIDGVMDPAYKLSFSRNLFSQTHQGVDKPAEQQTKGWAFWSTLERAPVETKTDANIYYLWDDTALYAFIEVTWGAIKGETTEAAYFNLPDTWMFSGVWLYLQNLPNGKPASSVVKLGFEAYGRGIKAKLDALPDDTLKQGITYKAKKTTKGYNIEAKIPMKNMKKDMKISVALQVLDAFNPTSSRYVHQIGSLVPSLNPQMKLGAAVANTGGTTSSSVTGTSTAGSNTNSTNNSTGNSTNASTALSTDISNNSASVSAISDISGASMNSDISDESVAESTDLNNTSKAVSSATSSIAVTETDKGLQNILIILIVVFAVVFLLLIAGILFFKKKKTV